MLMYSYNKCMVGSNFYLFKEDLIIGHFPKKLINSVVK